MFVKMLGTVIGVSGVRNFGGGFSSDDGEDVD